MRSLPPCVWFIPAFTLNIGVAAKMVEIHAEGGLRRARPTPPSWAPVFYSTVLHFNELDAQIKDGDVVLMDVGGQYSGYTADITRTIPADGHFTPRQREIYEIVLGAQNAALAALKPGMTLGGYGPKSLYQIAFDYLNTHGADREGHPLGKYFIHGLGHHIGLEVHDAGEPNRPLEAGKMVAMMGARSVSPRGKHRRAHRGRRFGHAHRLSHADRKASAHSRRD